MEQQLSPRERLRGIYKVTIIGSVVNFILVIFKLVAGVLAGSAAMIADGVHSLSDFITDIVVLVFVKISGKPKNRNFNYGHGKFETLATLIIGAVLLVVGVGIAWEGIESIVAVIKGEVIPKPGMIALIAALVSIAAKEGLFRYSVRQGRKLRSEVVIANGWHHRSDAYSSIGTALGIGGAILLGHKWTVLDPIAAVVVSVFILRSAVQLMRPCVDELMERSLPDDVEEQIVGIVNSCVGIYSSNELHTRKIGYNYAIEICVVMEGSLSLSEAHFVANGLEDKLRDKYGSETHVVIHMEPLRSDDNMALS